MIERDTRIDSYRGFLMCLVVFGHVIQYMTVQGNSHWLFRAIYSFHMPAFFFLSGMLCDTSLLPNKVKVIKKMLRLLLPFFIWSFILCFLRGDGLLDFLVKCDKGYWFLFVLAECFIVQWLASVVVELLGLEHVWYLMLAMSMFAGGHFLPTGYMGLNLLCGKYIYFACGILFRDHMHLFQAKYKWSTYVILGLFITILYVYTFVDLPFVATTVIRLTSSILGCVACLLLFLNIKYASMDFFRIIGTNTIGIYVIHIILMFFAGKFVAPRQFGLLSFVWTTVFILISLLCIASIKQVKWMSYILLGDKIK